MIEYWCNGRTDCVCTALPSTEHMNLTGRYGHHIYTKMHQICCCLLRFIGANIAIIIAPDEQFEIGGNSLLYCVLIEYKNMNSSTK